MRIRLLGSPEIHYSDGSTPAFTTAKSEGLFYYLVATQKVHTRALLAQLFWRDMSEAKARVNLTKAFSDLRHQVGDCLTISTQSVAFTPQQPHWLDLTIFLTATTMQAVTASPQALEKAAALYRGEFLAGFHVRNAPEFDHWLLVERERLRALAVQAFSTIATGYQQLAEYGKAIGAWQRLLAIERWHENAHVALMQLFVESGEPHKALKQYEQCCAALADELDVEPGSATTILYERIRAEGGAAGAGEPPTASRPLSTSIKAEASSAHPPHNLPHLPTPFIGRETEISAMLARLQDPDCRLLTLVGPGGIGKTRLALAVAQRLTQATAGDPFVDGIFFVALMPVDTAAGMIAAIANAIGFTFYSNVPPKQQLLAYLEYKTMLLVLDNFEHLLATAPVLAEMLATIANLKIVITSRNPVPLQWAYFYPVQGLSYPKENPTTALAPPHDLVENYDAFHLFVRLAQRHQVAFAVQQNRDHIIRICRLVDGTPLALELAAAWLKVLPCSRIVQALEASPDLLQTDLADVPDRHRSIKAVFAQSWQLLNTEEQAVLQKLAVFRGGFTLDAATQVAQATLYHLASFTEKVLIQVDETGRYQMHELLRQFARERLVTDPETEKAICAVHANFFLQMLAQDVKPTVHHDDLIQADLDNIRTAWLWAIRNSAYVALDNALDCLYEFYYRRCRYSEGQELLATSLADIHVTDSEPKSILSTTLTDRLFVRRVTLDYLLGQAPQTEQLLHSALERARATNQQRECAFILAGLGQSVSWQSEERGAAAYLQESLQLYQAVGDQLNTAYVHFLLAEMYSHTGDFRQGATHAQACVQIGEQLERAALTGHGLATLGFAYFGLGHYDLSLESYRKSRRAFEKTGDRLGYALATGGVGHALWQLEPHDWSRAAELALLSLEICRAIGHRLHTGTRLFMLGQIHLQEGFFAQSLSYAKECIQLAERAGYHLIVIGGLWVLSEGCRALGNFADSRQHIRRAVQLSIKVGIYLHLSHLATSYAVLLVQEAAQLPPLAAREQQVNAVALATAAFTYPAWHLSRRQAEQLLERQRAVLSGEQFIRAQNKAQTQALEALLLHLLD